MMNKEMIKRMLRPFYGPVMSVIRNNRKLRFVKQDVVRVERELASSDSMPRVLYLGITAHSNLGDMGQYYCIHNWIMKNYPTHKLIEVEADTVVNEKYNFIELLRGYYRTQDIIVFQSGYTTQDLGGVHDLMHRMVIEALPDAHILMMPQTIYFQHEENRLRSARIYNKGRQMLFLARDRVSYEAACKMMPDVKVKLFPDIVSTLIGKFDFTNAQRNGVILCRRSDGEKFYSDGELNQLVDRINAISHVIISDTTIKKDYRIIQKNLEKYIENVIESFSKFEVTITDRYHGTIFSLAAGTPVIIIKTTDHKVITGADWFKGVYDDYVYVAEDLDDAFNIYMKLRTRHIDYRLLPYFNQEYYSKLKDIFSKMS